MFNLDIDGFLPVSGKGQPQGNTLLPRPRHQVPAELSRLSTSA